MLNLRRFLLLLLSFQERHKKKQMFHQITAADWGSVILLIVTPLLGPNHHLLAPYFSAFSKFSKFYLLCSRVYIDIPFNNHLSILLFLKLEGLPQRRGKLCCTYWHDAVPGWHRTLEIHLIARKLYKTDATTCFIWWDIRMTNVYICKINPNL